MVGRHYNLGLESKSLLCSACIQGTHCFLQVGGNTAADDNPSRDPEEHISRLQALIGRSTYSPSSSDGDPGPSDRNNNGIQQHSLQSAHTLSQLASAGSHLDPAQNQHSHGPQASAHSNASVSRQSQHSNMGTGKGRADSPPLPTPSPAQSRAQHA